MVTSKIDDLLWVVTDGIREDACFQKLNENAHYKRGIKLAKAPAGSGHDSFLKGVIVQADFIAPRYWWNQAQRYRRFDIISSQSQMHKILSMNISSMCPNSVSVEAIDNANMMIKLHKEGKVDFETVLDNLPQGMNLGAAVTTNYLQLKTMYEQRHNHRLTDWSVDFKEWVQRLPMSAELIRIEDTQSA